MEYLLNGFEMFRVHPSMILINDIKCCVQGLSFATKRRVSQVGRSRRCASMEARPSLWRAALDCFASLAMTRSLLRCDRNDTQIASLRSQ
jgi:hypothetical protein